MTCNESSIFSTHEGIDVCGERVALEICSVLEANPSLQYFSIIGHSLGGLFSRYCIGILYEKNLFISAAEKQSTQESKKENEEENSTLPKLVPLNFITFSSPHMGSRRTPRNWFNPVASWFTSTLLSKSGRQLMLEDSENPLLVEMADPNSRYFRALQLFKQRILYSNITRSDIQVPFSTAMILPYNPFLEDYAEETCRRYSYNS